MNAERLDYQSESVAPVYPETSDRGDIEVGAGIDTSYMEGSAHDGITADGEDDDIDDDCSDLSHIPVVAAASGFEDPQDDEPSDRQLSDDSADAEPMRASDPPDDVPPDGPGSGGLFEGDDFNQPDAALVDGLFEVFAGDPPTDEEANEVRAQDEAIRWLGTDRVNPFIFRTFNADRHGDSDALDSIEAVRLCESQVSRLTESLAEVDEGVRATQALGDLIERYVDRYVVERIGMLPEWLDGRYYVAQHVVEPTETGFEVAETRLRRDVASPEPAMLRHDHPDGEVRLVAPNAQQRYRVQYTPEDGVAVTRETIRSLGPSDASYFRDLNILLSNHSQNLRHVALLAGFSPNELNDHSGKIEAVTSDMAFQFSIPESLRRAIVNNNKVIRRTLNQTLTRDPYTHQAEDAGLFTVAERVRTYFEALLDGPDDGTVHKR